MPYHVEVTDTFGGEANYSWVRRYTVEAPTCEYRSPSYNRTLVRRAKAAAGWQGLRCRVEDFGDEVRLIPVGRSAPCWVLFCSWVEAEESEEEAA